MHSSRVSKPLIYLVAWVLVLLPYSHHAAPMFDADALQQLRQSYSPEAMRRGEALNKLLSELASAPVDKQLIEVNRFFNQFRYREDLDQWGEKDYWATPQEFVGVQIGDCEDFVIAKYFALRKLGVPDKRLYLTYVKALKQNVAHMVLSYFETPRSTPQILDNYNPRVLPASQRKDLLPVYSFNANSLFLNNASAGLGKSLPTDKIKNSKWKALLANIRKESS